jgi:hypothetical protein
VNPYAMLTQAGQEAQRRFLDEVQHWHDDMVMHQRVVRRLGPAACSEDCPHAEGRRLWKEARELFGPAADSLTFLRHCAGDVLAAAPSVGATAQRNEAAALAATAGRAQTDRGADRPRRSDPRAIRGG